MALSEDEIELAILRRYADQYKAANIASAELSDKCARELDMREVLRELTGEEGAALDHTTNLWFTRLVSSRPGVTKTALLGCDDSSVSHSTHRYHARAFLNATKSSAPVWDRIRELEASVSPLRPSRAPKELEQKFRILLAAPQAQKDFLLWVEDAKENQYQIAVLFLDIDCFKPLNAKYTETRIDASILPEAQRLIRRNAAVRGEAYRYGGEEFLIILPNHDTTEAMAFAEKVRTEFSTHEFDVDGVSEKVTISVGVALWPDHGADFARILQAANEAERSAKGEGRNRVKLAD